MSVIRQSPDSVYCQYFTFLPNTMLYMKENEVKEYRYKKKTVHFVPVTGTVISTKKYGETHVSSSGGGGYVHQGSGSISAPTIHSHTQTKHEFWIKTPEGKEEPVQLSGHDIPLKEGQKISLIFAINSDNKKHSLSVLVNHSAKKHWIINNGRNINVALEIALPSYGRVISIVAAIFLIFFLLNNMFYWGFKVGELFFIVAIFSSPFIVYRFIVAFIRSSRVSKDIGKHLEDVSQWAYQNL